MTKETKSNLQSLLANTDFYKGLYDCMKCKEAFAYFKTHGLELTDEEALRVWNDVELDAGKFGAISDEALEAVAGGCAEWGCDLSSKPGECNRVCLF